MYLTTTDPFTREFDRIVRRAFGPVASVATVGRQVLPLDTIRREGEVVLRFDVPGVAPEQISVTVDKGVLTVSATREDALAEGEERVVRERYAGTASRTVRLTDTLDADAIEASHANGVLELRIPVREAAKPRRIEVAAAQALQA
jgi:HSP20 family protein